jgi:hypothetical protein
MPTNTQVKGQVHPPNNQHNNLHLPRIKKTRQPRLSKEECRLILPLQYRLYHLLGYLQIKSTSTNHQGPPHIIPQWLEKAILQLVHKLKRLKFCSSWSILHRVVD